MTNANLIVSPGDIVWLDYGKPRAESWLICKVDNNPTMGSQWAIKIYGLHLQFMKMEHVLTRNKDTKEILYIEDDFILLFSQDGKIYHIGTGKEVTL